MSKKPQQLPTTATSVRLPLEISKKLTYNLGSISVREVLEALTRDDNKKLFRRIIKLTMNSEIKDIFKKLKKDTTTKSFARQLEISKQSLSTVRGNKLDLRTFLSCIACDYDFALKILGDLGIDKRGKTEDILKIFNKIK